MADSQMAASSFLKRAEEVHSELLSLKEAAQLIPKSPNMATLFRWTTRGVRGVVLQSYKFNGRQRWILPADLDSFLAEINGEQQ